MYEKDYKGTLCLVPKGCEEKFLAEGGFFNKEQKVFVFPDTEDIETYDHWFPKNGNILCNYQHYILESKVVCWKCRKPATVIALASQSFHYKIPPTRKGCRWAECDDGIHIFSHIRFIPFHVLNQIQKRYSHFKSVYSFTHKYAYFANTCEHCGIIQEDYYLHELPSGVFYADSRYVSRPRVYLETIGYQPAYGFLMEAKVARMEKMGFWERGGEPCFWYDGFLAPLAKDDKGDLWYYDFDYHYLKDE